ncbi:MAG: YgiT-type zinc finger protein [Candidatus Stahlbacteria bacterium]|nr:YgiT-type zinc finger protein [Candidatus Stahlbacteria bacterium]
MICEFCGGKTESRKVKKHHWLHDRLYLIENVEAEVCCDCGERYFYVKVLDTIDAMLQTQHNVERYFQVEVVRV